MAISKNEILAINRRVAGVDLLRKDELLSVLQHVDQHFWPPRPTRQEKATILAAIKNAIRAGRYTYSPSHVH